MVLLIHEQSWRRDELIYPGRGQRNGMLNLISFKPAPTSGCSILSLLAALILKRMSDRQFQSHGAAFVPRCGKSLRAQFRAQSGALTFILGLIHGIHDRADGG